MATPKAMEDIRNMTPIVLEHLLYQHIHFPKKLIQVYIDDAKVLDMQRNDTVNP